TPPYPALFARAFPGDGDPCTIPHVIQGLASFERSLIAARAPYDRFQAGDATALSASAKRGQALFFSRSVRCFRCHSGVTFSEATELEVGHDIAFHNTGLYNLPGLFSYPASDTGLYQITQDSRDVGKFKAPTLRNIALTAPYMHDGS